MNVDRSYHKSAVVIGASAGGMDALQIVFSGLKQEFEFPIIVVLHVGQYGGFGPAYYFAKSSHLKFVEAESLMHICPGTIYFAPEGYHILVEKDEQLTLSVEEKVNFSRPSIDVLFETAAECYGRKLTGILLTGASVDGSKGLKKIKDYGGCCIVQNPDTAFMPYMPSSALKIMNPDFVMNLEDIRDFLATKNFCGGLNSYV